MSRTGMTSLLADSLPGGNLASDPLDSSNREELRRLKSQLHHQLVVAMDLSAIGTMDNDALRLEVRRVTDELCQRSSNLLSRGERERLVTEVLDETFGLGPLEPLMNDPLVTDILINGYKTVYVEKNGQLERAAVVLRRMIVLGPGQIEADHSPPLVSDRELRHL